MEKCDEMVNYETEKIIANADISGNNQTSSPSDMNLTIPVNSYIVQCTPLESDVIRKESDKTPDIVKKVRFSDQHDTLSFKSLTESFAKSILNISAEKENDVFDDVCEISHKQNAKNAENLKDPKNITKNVKDTKDTKDNQAEDKKCPEKLLTDSQIEIAQDNNAQGKNRSPEINNASSALKTHVNATSEQGCNEMMTVLMENHSCGYNTDLVSLIDGLKKLQEQFTSMSCQLSSNTNKSLSAVNLHRKSITKMEMKISRSVESNSINSATNITNRQIISSSSSFMQNDENKNNDGFLSTVTQAMKSALRSFSS